jgi:hypothetical protein
VTSSPSTSGERVQPTAADAQYILVERPAPSREFIPNCPHHDLPTPALVERREGSFRLRQLHQLAAIIGSRNVALRRDECGEWRIEGRRGWVYAVSGTLTQQDRAGFQIYCAPGSARAWAHARKAMTFAELTLDGDDEGLLFLARLPTPDEAAILRDKLGIAKKRDVSEAERGRLSKIGKATAFVRQDGVVGRFRTQGTALNDPPGSGTSLGSDGLFHPGANRDGRGR